jgi:hypothetical protein
VARLISAARPTTSFPARLDGGSKRVPSHLDGRIYVSTNRIELQAFPQEEDLVWSCGQIKQIGQHRWSEKELVAVDTATMKFWFNMNSARKRNVLLKPYF